MKFGAWGYDPRQIPAFIMVRRYDNILLRNFSKNDPKFSKIWIFLAEIVDFFLAKIVTFI